MDVYFKLIYFHTRFIRQKVAMAFDFCRLKTYQDLVMVMMMDTEDMIKSLKDT